MSYTEIESENQFNEFLAKYEHVIVDFYAAWCGPCKVLAEKFNEVKAKHPNIHIMKVDVDNEALEDIVEKHGVSSLPHIFYYHKKTRMGNFEGNQINKLMEFAAKSD